MYKNILLAALLTLVSFAFGVLAGYKFAPSAGSSTTPNNALISSMAAGTITQTVSGKVVQVDGKSMIIETNGKKVTVKMEEKVDIFKSPVPSQTQKQATPGATPKPNEDFSFQDFKQVPVGSQISATLELQPDGTFLAKSVFLMPKP